MKLQMKIRVSSTSYNTLFSVTSRVSSSHHGGENSRILYASVSLRTHKYICTAAVIIWGFMLLFALRFCCLHIYFNLNHNLCGQTNNQKNANLKKKKKIFFPSWNWNNFNLTIFFCFVFNCNKRHTLIRPLIWTSFQVQQSISRFDVSKSIHFKQSLID